MVIVLLGVSGSGKSTVGRLLARELGFAFHDADDLHPSENRAKMASGTPLDDADRAGWVERLRDLVARLRAEGTDAVLAFSGLRRAHRERVAGSAPGDGRGTGCRARSRHGDAVRFVYLRGSRELLQQRLAARTGHFCPPQLLDSQLAALEEPADALVVEIDAPPAALASEIAGRLKLQAAPRGDAAW